MEQKEGNRYFVSWVRWQGQDGYALWVSEPNDDLYWTDNRGNIPIFTMANEVETLAARLGIQLYPEEPALLDLDKAWQWLQASSKQPPAACLYAWHVFSDVATGTTSIFIGEHHAPVRDRVFDLLYAYYGPWMSVRKPWTRQERNVLKRILQQGFRLWQKYTYQTTLEAVPLPPQHLAS